MRKHLSFIFGVVIGSVLIAIPASASLWQYYQEQGINLPSIEKRLEVAKSCGIDNYRGTASQNVALEQCLRGLSDKDQFIVGSTLPIAGSTYNLAGSGVTGSATSIILNSLTITQTGQKINDSDLSDTFYITLEPGNTKKQEIVSCTTVVQNANGTATLSGCSRGLAPIYPYTSSTTLQFTHAGGSQVIFSDPPQLLNRYANKANDETITGQFTYDVYPKYSSTTTIPIFGSQFATKYYVDAQTSAGFSSLNASTTRGLVTYGTAPETVGINASTTNGLEFLTDGSLAVKVNTARMKVDSNGVDVDQSKDFTFGGNTTFATSTFNGQVTFNGLTNLNGNLYSAIAGEQLSLGNSVIVASGTEQFLSNQFDNEGSTFSLTGTNWLSQSFVSNGGKLSSFLVFMNAGGSAGNLVISVRAVSGNLPTGSDIDSQTATVAFTGGSETQTATFATPPLLASGTRYAIVMRATSGTAVIRLSSTNADATYDAAGSTNSGSSWTTQNKEARCQIYEKTIPGRIYKSDGNGITEEKANFIGFSYGNYNASTTASIVVNGPATYSSAITPGALYYISDTEGAIGTTAGTFSKKVGIGISDTQLLIRHDNP